MSISEHPLHPVEWLGFILIAFILMPFFNTAMAVPPEQANQPPLYVVVFKDTPGARYQDQELAQSHGAVHLYRSVFRGFAAPLSEGARQALLKNPNVELIEPEFEVFAVEGELPTGVDRIDAEIAHQVGAVGIGARIAVVDTGIQSDHPDLFGQVDTNLSRTFVSRGKTTVDGYDDHGHGTHVAGTISAIANGIGVIGVAPQASLVALKVLNKRGSGSSVDIIAALDFITAHNQAAGSYAEMIHVANFSLGGNGSDSDSAYRRAFDAAVDSGCFIAVAAGNESDDAANYVPAAYDSVFTVSAMDPLTNSFASFSNYGMDVDMAAPGVNIYSTYLGSTYRSASGTSMATPHVAGSAALYVGEHLSGLAKASAVEDIRFALIASAEVIALPGDPDGIQEPLVDAEAIIGSIGDPDPALTLSLASDQGSYTGNDSQAVLTVMPRDELGDAVMGLGDAAFDVTGAVKLNPVLESIPGNYQFAIDISGFTLDTDYPVTVEVTDSRGLVASALIVITRVSAKTIYVTDIRYKANKRNLQIPITVSDTGDNPIEGAVVSITLNLNDSPYASGSAITGSDGVVTFQLRNAPNGHYSTTINDVSKDGTLYESSLNTPDPGFDK